jgi:DNA-binding MarR family transcriptional regulator
MSLTGDSKCVTAQKLHNELVHLSQQTFEALTSAFVGLNYVEREDSQLRLTDLGRAKLIEIQTTPHPYAKELRSLLKRAPHRIKPMSDEIARIASAEEQKIQVLTGIYELSGGSTRRVVWCDRLLNRLGISRSEVNPLFNQLAELHAITRLPDFRRVSVILRPKGRRIAIEEIKAHRIRQKAYNWRKLLGILSGFLNHPIIAGLIVATLIAVGPLASAGLHWIFAKFH